MRETRPARMVEEAIQGMLPKTKLGKQMYRKLQVYAGPKHPHDAQKPAGARGYQARRYNEVALVQHLGTGRRKTRGGESVSAVGQGRRSR